MYLKLTSRTDWSVLFPSKLLKLWVLLRVAGSIRNTDCLAATIREKTWLLDEKELLGIGRDFAAGEILDVELPVR